MRRQSFATVLIGKHVLIREGISRILRANNFPILASISCPDEMPSAVHEHPLLFLIVHASNDLDLALEQTRVVKTQHPNARVAIVADHYLQDGLELAFRAGAAGYLVNVISCDAFIKSIELVMMGETVFPTAFASIPLGSRGDHEREAELPEETPARVAAEEHDVAPQLSPREATILCCLIEGHSNKSIARKIDIAEATVKVHIKAILRKIRVQNRTQAAIWAINNGWPARSVSTGVRSARLHTSQPMPNAISSIMQIDRSDLAESINDNANHVGVPRIDRLIGKRNIRRAHRSGTA